MATKVWRGFLSVGALSIPVYLNCAARDQKIALNTFHTTCNGPVKMPKFCPQCDLNPVPPDEIFKAYDTGNGLVPITEEEMDAITPETERVMEVSQCVKMSDIDISYFAESFYLLPDPAGQKAYSLLVKTLKDSDRVAIAQLTKSGREHLVVLRPKGNGLMLHYMFYQTEIARVPEFESLPMAQLAPNEIKLATQLIENMESVFSPEDFEDAYFQRMNTLIASKLDSKIAAPTPVKAAANAPTQDLMAALSASLTTVKARRHIAVEEPPVAKGKPAKKKKAA
jgi:DNA end-binding protein Ku